MGHGISKGHGEVVVWVRVFFLRISKVWLAG